MELTLLSIQHNKRNSSRHKLSNTPYQSLCRRRQSVSSIHHQPPHDLLFSCLLLLLPTIIGFRFAIYNSTNIPCLLHSKYKHSPALGDLRTTFAKHPSSWLILILRSAGLTLCGLVGTEVLKHTTPTYTLKMETVWFTERFKTTYPTSWCHYRSDSNISSLYCEIQLHRYPNTGCVYIIGGFRYAITRVGSVARSWNSCRLHTVN
jgi:hypothetical protein